MRGVDRPDLLDIVEGAHFGTEQVHDHVAGVDQDPVAVRQAFDPRLAEPVFLEGADDVVGQGADVITHHTDSTAVVQAAEEKGKYAIAYHSDMKKYGPKAQLAAVTHHWGAYYTKQAQAVIDGTWKTSSTWGGIKDGMVKLEGINNSVPADVKQFVAAREKDMVDGKLNAFTAPIKDNSGKVRLEKGVLDDAALSKMDYFVEGVAGKVSGK